ncbi:XRE family transcriptional regulator [bacterium D16-50]|nr:XRE family transcriptional regulator [bacterium D16-50]
MFVFPTIDMLKTGQNILRLRKQAGLSVKNLQDIFGFSTPQAIYKWQHGTALPTIDNLVVLAAVFQVRVDDILAVEAESEAGMQVSA